LEDRGSEATAERLLALPGGLLLQQQQSQQLDQMRSNLARLMALPAAEKPKKEYLARLDLSWVYHDSALEGIVYQNPELIQAMRGDPAPDPTLVATFDEIRQIRAAIELAKTMAKVDKLRIDLDTLRDLYEKLAPDEMEGKKQPTYRKDMPVHRLYFHEIATPDKILPKLKLFFQWINASETRKSTHVVRLAAKAHFHLLHIYPFPKHSGRIARLVMNVILLNQQFPPAIIHSTERQRYYDALKTNDNALAGVVREALVASMESATRFFEGSLPPPPPPPVKKIPRPVARPTPPPRPITRPPLSKAALSRPPARAIKPPKPIIPKTSGPLPKAFVSKSSIPTKEPLLKTLGLRLRGPVAAPVAPLAAPAKPAGKGAKDAASTKPTALAKAAAAAKPGKAAAKPGTEAAKPTKPTKPAKPAKPSKAAKPAKPAQKPGKAKPAQKPAKAKPAQKSAKAKPGKAKPGKAKSRPKAAKPKTRPAKAKSKAAKKSRR
jgi:hypothetical protein